MGLTVHLWDERLTTTEAHRHLDEAGHGGRMERKSIIDQVAAVLILQGFLDARRAGNR
jgi:putative Holliday junction resolvase